MNHSTKTASILESDQFKKLVRKRWTISLLLTITMLSIYFGYLLLISFKKESLSKQILENMPIAIPMGLGLIFSAWLFTGIYVSWANKYYDNEVNQLKNQFDKINN
jgi:uncharacterized membrane protein (DUF485 family)